MEKSALLLQRQCAVSPLGALKSSRRQLSGLCRQRHIVYASGKGFGDVTKPGKDAPPKKRSKRGTVASRGVGLTKKEEKQLRMDYEEQKKEIEQSDMGQDSSEFQEVPSVVNDRILKRILIFTGVPVFSAFLLFPLFYYLKVGKGLDIPNIAVFALQSLIFGGALLGISYGALSASWSPNKEGSLLGVEEFKTNIQVLLDRNKSS